MLLQLPLRCRVRKEGREVSGYAGDILHCLCLGYGKGFLHKGLAALEQFYFSQTWLASLLSHPRDEAPRWNALIYRIITFESIAI